MEIIGEALLAAVSGASHRSIATDLHLPADTVRGWMRAATTHASWLRRRGTIAAHEFDAELAPIRATHHPDHQPAF